MREAINTISWLRELVQGQRGIDDAADFLEAVKGEVTPEVIYVFTPVGEIIRNAPGINPGSFRLRHPYAGRSPVHGCKGQ